MMLYEHEMLLVNAYLYLNLQAEDTRHQILGGLRHFN